MLDSAASFILFLCVVYMFALSLISAWLTCVTFNEGNYAEARRSFYTTLVCVFLAVTINVLR